MIVARLSCIVANYYIEEEDDPRVGGQWRIATLSRRGKCSPAAGETQMFVRLLVLLLRVQWCPLALPSRRSSSNPAARHGIPAPAGAAAPDGGSFGGTVG